MDFEEIYYLYFRQVFLYIRSLSGDENIAEEIAQEVFFKALKSINTFDGSKDIQAWLFTIAKNTYFSHYKKNKRNISYDSLDEIPSTGVTIIEHLSNEEDAFIIHQFLHTMEEPSRNLIYIIVKMIGLPCWKMVY